MLEGVLAFVFGKEVALELVKNSPLMFVYILFGILLYFWTNKSITKIEQAHNNAVKNIQQSHNNTIKSMREAYKDNTDTLKTVIANLEKKVVGKEK